MYSQISVGFSYTIHRRSFFFAFKKMQVILIQGRKIKAGGLKVWMQIYILWERESISKNLHPDRMEMSLEAIHPAERGAISLRRPQA